MSLRETLKSAEMTILVVYMSCHMVHGVSVQHDVRLMYTYKRGPGRHITLLCVEHGYLGGYRVPSALLLGGVLRVKWLFSLLPRECFKGKMALFSSSQEVF